ncbi:MAG: hypothetical protein ABJB61_10680 [bacterium]
MSKFRHTLNLLALVIFTLTVSSLAQAQATRTWVSGVGDDANPCSRTAPCKTFAGAISKTAAAGEINAIDSGGFGSVTITKSITIDGGAVLAGILASFTNGIIVNDSAATPTANVNLRNLSIDGAGNGLNGIRLLKAKTVAIENVHIFGFTGNGIDAPLSAVATGGTFAYFNDVSIRNLSGAGSIGIALSAPGTFAATMDHVRVERIPTGVQVGTNCIATIRDSLITLGTTGVNMLSGSIGTIENTMLMSHTTALNAGSGSTTRISQVSIILNSTGISTGGGVVQSSGNNRILGNTSDGLTPSIVNPK